MARAKPSAPESAPLTFTAVIEPAEEGGYVVTFPAIPDLATQGETVEQARLIAEDCLAADWRSFGISWTAIELESPKAKLLTKNGDFTARTNHAIRQIQDWRTWLGKNIDYANRPRHKEGLGLIDIDSRIRGIVFIGRRSEVDEKANARRRQLAADLGISLHSFDSLIDSARQEAERGSRALVRDG